MSGHHLILGQLTDILTGETIEDNHDERYRQSIARLLLEKKGYARADIRARTPLTVRAGKNSARVYPDFLVSVNKISAMLIRYGPGSVVTRRQPAMAMAHLLAPHEIPLVVVTNGIDAEILRTRDNEIIGTGLDAIPGRKELTGMIASFGPLPLVPDRRREMAARLVYCYEVDGACPCDETICRL
ncbi:MAG: hypothetical protein CSB33_03865 [Desulfobacterales bacterium]|nr:MAG: hypothetical protein CSB33_03865 [Desulfobacterales bacterium]